MSIAAILCDYLNEEIAKSGRIGSDSIFGRAPELLCVIDRVQECADAAWEAAEIERLTLYDCRHTFASLMIAAGVNAKALQTYIRPREHQRHSRPLRPLRALTGA